MAVVNWHPDTFLSQFEDDIEKRLEKAGRVVMTESRRLIREPKFGAVPPHRIAVTRSINGKSRTDWKFKNKGARGGWQYDWKVPRSRPGQAPAWQTGTLGLHIFYQLRSPTSVIVGVPALNNKKADPRYGLYLEVGTSKMAPRPYLRPALTNKRDRIQKIFSGKYGGA